MNTQFITEGASPLSGLPKHWIKYLAERWGKGGNYGDQAGEKSIVTPIKRFDGGNVSRALKDKTNLAVIGRIDGEPLFMIAPHDNYKSKFRVFEVNKSEGNYDSKGESSYRGRRGRRRVTQDAFTMGQVIDIVDKLFSQYADKDLTVEAISKDLERDEKVKSRREQKNIVDPLETSKRDSWRDPDPSKAQRERGKKWAAKKLPLLDVKMDNEAKKMKDKINAVLDDALNKALADVKKGYTYGLNKEILGKAILAQVDLTPILNLAKGYDALKSDYNSEPAYKKAKDLKRTGLIP